MPFAMRNLKGTPEKTMRRDDEDSSSTGDTSTLARLGKKQVLKRRFGLFPLLGFATTILITWEAVLALFSEGLDNGGPAELVYGFIIAWLSTLSVYTVISELASCAPIAGGQYFWVFMLAPPGWKNLASYTVGWLNTLAWVATLATGSIFTGTIIQGLIILNYASYEPHSWHGTLLAIAVIFVSLFINLVLPEALPKIELFVLVFHIAGFIAILVTVVVMADHANPASVFLTSVNEGGWPTQGLSYLVGFLGNVATFVGADASVHMSEEIDNAALNVPRAIFFTMVFNGALGFGMMVAILFCLGNLDQVLDTPTGYPFIEVFFQATNSHAGTSVMTAVVLSLVWASVIGYTATSSRMAWSFARDKGVPFHRFISKVEPRTRIPMVSVGVISIIPCLLVLIYIGSPVAFNDVVSLTITGFYASYLMPCSLLLWRRIKGQIADHNSHTFNTSQPAPTTQPNSSTGVTVLSTETMTWGPWRVPGILGIINNAYACVYMVFVIFWSFWPPATPTTATNMNYSIVVTFGIIILSMIWYFFVGRKEYKGPLVETQVDIAA